MLPFKQSLTFDLGIGIGSSTDDGGNVVLVKKKGKVQMLQNGIIAQEEYLNFAKIRICGS